MSPGRRHLRQTDAAPAASVRVGSRPKLSVCASTPPTAESQPCRKRSSVRSGTPVCLPRGFRPRGCTRTLEQFDLRAGGGFRSVLTYETHDAPGKYSAHSDVTETKILEMDAPHKIVWSVRFPSEDPSFAGTMFMEWTFEAVLSDDPEQTPARRSTPISARSSPCRRRMSRRGSTPRNTSPGSSHRCASSPAVRAPRALTPATGYCPSAAMSPACTAGAGSLRRREGRRHCSRSRSRSSPCRSCGRARCCSPGSRRCDPTSRCDFRCRSVPRRLGVRRR